MPGHKAATGLGLAAVLGAVGWFLLRAPPALPAPEARWRNGVIVDVRHCEAPATEAHVLRCAALYCAQRASERLTNAQQARIRLQPPLRAAGGRTIEVNATLEQFLNTPRLPSGFRCRMRHFRHAEPEFLFRGSSGPRALTPAPR